MTILLGYHRMEYGKDKQTVKNYKKFRPRLKPSTET
jgi:hypothetical protein